MGFGNSPYLSFAKYLKRELHYPIGLIQTSLGGSPLSRWNPEETGDLYANMLEIIKKVNGEIKGVLWYQGCSDVEEDQATTYLERFNSMVKQIRCDLNHHELPFLTVQISRVTCDGEEKIKQGWSKIREAQRQAIHKINHVFVIPSQDVTMSDLIHISSVSNLALGERLAKVALQKVYHKSVKALAPDIHEVYQVGEKAIKLSFANVNQRLYYYDVPANKLSFRVEDACGGVNISSYQIIDPNGIILHLERELIGNGYVHNSYGMNPEGVVPVDFSTHLPILAFYMVEVKKESSLCDLAI